MLRLLIIDDHAIVREGYRRLLERRQDLRIVAEAGTADGESLGRSRLAVRREDGISEHFQVQQNRALLERLAAATGGRYFTLDEADDIPEAVQFSDAGIVERRLLELWNMPFLFLLLVALKSGEWLARLWWGRL